VAQDREVLSKQIAIGRNEASLRLEFEAGDPLAISFLNGAVRVNDAELGAYAPELDAAWRALLSHVVTLEDGPLARALREWTPPGDLPGGSLELATRLDAALEGALGEQTGTASPDAGTTRERRAFAELLARQERLEELAAATRGLQTAADVRLYVAESVEVAADEEVAATVVLVDADMTVHGLVAGDVVVVGGRLRVEPGGRITGDVRTVDGRVEREGGEIVGDVVEVDERELRALDEDVEDRIRREILSEVRGELAEDEEASFVGRIFSPFRNLVRAVVGVLSSLLTIVVLSVIGGVVVHFAHNHLEVVAETARRAPGRAAAVGLAGTFLAVPVWLLGAVALVISIIGIPVALLWLPLFPVALALAGVLGYYAVARNVGGWLARREYPYLGWVRLSNPITLVAGGVLGLLGAFVVSNALAIGGPWLGFLRGLFLTAGILMTVGAVLVGLGAVLITRGGRRPEYYPVTDFFEERRDEDLGGTAEGAL
jgi:cytoskeletal protein CcmA (bactofilin family)